MAKITLKDPGANYRSTNQIKSNNDLIEAAIENTLSRDGTSPNQMEANLDMNSYELLNAVVRNLTVAETLTVTDNLVFNGNATIGGNLTISGTVDGRDVSVDGAKLDTVEVNADVTDATNVAAAGAVMDGDFTTDGLMARTSPGVYASRILGAGDGLTGTNLDGVSGNPTFNINAGTGITVSSDAVSTNDSQIVHDNLSGFVSDEHVAHTGVVLTAGSGLTGGGSIAASRTFAVGAGTGIAVNADDVTLSHLGLESLTAPAGDRLYFYDQSLGDSGWLVPSSGLTLTGSDLTADVQSVAGETGIISAAALRTAINVENGADVTDAANVTTALGTISVNALSDVNTAGATAGNTLVWDAVDGEWQPSAAGSGDLVSTNNLSDVGSAPTALSNLGGQPLDSGLTSLSGLTTAADQGLYLTAADTYATFSLTTAGRALLDDADASAQRTTLGLVIGTDVQAYDADLAAIAGLTSAANKLPYFTGSGTAAVTDLSAFGRTLIDDADASAARTTLGLGTIASQDANNVNIDGGTIDGLSQLSIGSPASVNAIHHVKSATDANAVGIFAGVSYSVRLGSMASSAVIEGVDVTGTHTYQPLLVNGSDLRFGNGGTERARLVSGTLLLNKTSPTNPNLPAGSIEASGVVQDAVGPVNVRAFGANPSATAAANLTAFNSAATLALASDRPIYIPAGKYDIGGEWALSAGVCRIIGDGMNATELNFTGNAGLKFTGGSSSANYTVNQFVLEGVRIVHGGDTQIGDGLHVTFTASASAAVRTIIKDVLVLNGGTASVGNYWDNGIVLENAGEMSLTNTHVMFFGDISDTCVDIRGSTTQSYFFTNFNECNFNGAKTTIKQRGWVESVYFSNCSGVGGTDILDFDSSAVTSGTPHLTITGGHWNAKRDLLKLNNWRTVYVTGADLYSGVGSGDVTGTQITLVDVDHAQFVGCKIESGAVSGTILRDAAHLTDCTNVSFTGCTFLRQNQPAVNITGTGTENVRFSNCFFEGSGTKDSSDAILIASGIVGKVSVSGCQFKNFVDAIDDAGGHATITGCSFDTVTNGINGASGTVASNNKFQSVSGTEAAAGVQARSTNHFAKPGPSFNPGSTPDQAAYVASGGFGGGYMLQDGAGRAGMWVINSGNTLRIGAGGTSAGVSELLSLDSSLASAGAVVASQDFILASPDVPATASADGITGQISWDSGYIYVCTATNTWKRAALTTW